MNKLQLDFLHCYMIVYNKQNSDIFDIIRECSYELKNPSYMREFVDSYNKMKHYGLEWEVLQLVEKGATFLGACEEWDVLCANDYYIEKEY